MQIDINLFKSIYTQPFRDQPTARLPGMIAPPRKAEVGI